MFELFFDVCESAQGESTTLRGVLFEILVLMFDALMDMGDPYQGSATPLRGESLAFLL